MSPGQLQSQGHFGRTSETSLPRVNPKRPAPAVHYPKEQLQKATKTETVKERQKTPAKVAQVSTRHLKEVVDAPEDPDLGQTDFDVSMISNYDHMTTKDSGFDISGYDAGDCSFALSPDRGEKKQGNASFSALFGRESKAKGPEDKDAFSSKCMSTSVISLWFHRVLSVAFGGEEPRRQQNSNIFFNIFGENSKAPSSGHQEGSFSLFGNLGSHDKSGSGGGGFGGLNF